MNKKSGASLNILVTGATGFVGKSVVTKLVAQNFSVSALVRNDDFHLPDGATKIRVTDISRISDWHPILKNIDVVVHIAARAHILNDNIANSLAEFRKVNTYATLNLAKQAAEARVNRIIFISSIGVNGNYTIKPFSEKDEVNPQEPYAISKSEAEIGLCELVTKSKMEFVIIRPPLVYGPNAPGNFARLLEWVYKDIPLPFGAIQNQRSLVALENLVSFIIHCIGHPKAANEVFLISDGEDVSTTELLQKVAKAFGKKALLLPVPVSLMTFVARLLGKQSVVNRLFGSLQVDSSKARELLGWKPVITMDEQLKKTAEDF